MGNSLRFLGRYQEAIVSYQGAVEIDEGSFDAWGNMGVSYGHLGQHKMALECFDRALRLSPQDAHWRKMRDLAMQKMDQGDN